MKAFKFDGLLQNESWLIPAYVSCDEQGNIKEITQQATEGISYEEVAGYALPAFPNAHSHAFQYAMAGVAEKHATGKEADDFWSWREAMYQLALHVQPEEMEAIATMLYAEMLRHGYSQVAEFHYLHHDHNGQAYNNLAEMGSRLVAAAKRVGIKITLIPIFYQKGGFGQSANDRQRRFLSKDLDAYLRLFEASQEACKEYEGANVAYGVHSLRGVEPQTVKELAKIADPAIPFHLHISEQLKEVEDAMQYLGQRPVEWLLDNIELGDNFHLVHATHMTQQETKTLAQTGAYVVLCPSTEGNLGDGLFNLRSFQEAGGHWSIGTDSHIGLNPLEELRILDYGQRLTSHARNSFTDAQQGNSAFYAFNHAILAGRKAMGIHQPQFFAVGQVFDAMILDAKAPLLATASAENLANTILYASDISMQLGTIVNGSWRVKGGRHVENESIKTQFVSAIRKNSSFR